MDKTDEEKLKEYRKEIGKILRKKYFNSIETFREGELLLRDALLKEVNPYILGDFFREEKLAKETES